MPLFRPSACRRLLGVVLLACASTASFAQTDVLHWVGQTPGSCSALDARGHSLFVGAGCKLLRYDVTDPLAPVLLAEYDGSDLIRDVVALDSLVLLALEAPGLAVLDVSDPLRMRQVGASPPGGTARALAVQDTLVCMTTGAGGFHVYSLANPEHPRLLGSCPLDYADGFALQGDLAWVADDWSLTAVDLSDPRQPVVLQRTYTGLPVYDVAIEDDLATVAGRVGLRFYDVGLHGLALPAGILQLEDQPRFSRVRVRNGRVLYGAYDRGFKIVDCSDPGSPRLLFEHWFPHWATAYACEAVEVDGQLWCCAWSDGLWRLDLADLAEPVATLGPPAIGSALSAAVDGDRLFVGGYMGVQSWDLADPSRPVLRSSIQDPHLVMETLAAGGRGAALLNFEGLRTLDLSDPAAIEIAGEYHPSIFHHTQDVGDIDGELLWVAGSQFLAVFDDWSGEVEPFARHESALYTGLRCAGDRLYLAEEQGMRILDVADPTEPLLLGTYSSASRTGRLAVEDDIVCLVKSDIGLDVVDASDPGAPVRLALIEGLRTPMDVDLRNGIAAVAVFEGVRLYDLRDPAHPLEMGSWDTPTTPYRLAFEGELLLAACANSGVQILRLDPDCGVRAAPEQPAAIVLSRPHPNPFNPACRAEVRLATAGDCRVDLFNLLGQRVMVLHAGWLPAGSHSITVDGRGLASGNYWLRAERAGDQAVQRLTLLR